MSINPKDTYNIAQIARAGVLGVRTHKSIVSLVLRDMAGKNFFKARMIGSDTGIRYTIKGKDILRYKRLYSIKDI